MKTERTMISLHNSSKLSYIGPNSDLFKSLEPVDCYDKFIETILTNLKFNLELDIKNLCLDICSFKFSKKFFDEKIDEESDVTGVIIEKLRSLIVRNDSRIFFYIGKDYFLGSQIDSVRESTIILLKRLSEILDLLGIIGPSILIRVGSAYGSRKDTMEFFCQNVLALDKKIRAKLCVMNDEKPSLFSVTDLLSGVYYKSGIPICFRILPHSFNDGGLTFREALFLSCSTWKEEHKPIFIHSESKEIDFNGMPVSPRPSDFLRNRIPTFGLNVDIIVDSTEREDTVLKYKMIHKSLPPMIINKIS